jgi:cytochrome c-type biogenesis protein CcmF
VRNQQPQTESAIDPGLFRDIYVALGEPVGNDGAWAVRVHVKPFVRWIWLGALFMMFGGLVAAADRRFRRLPEPAPGTASGRAAASGADAAGAIA